METVILLALLVGGVWAFVAGCRWMNRQCDKLSFYNSANGRAIREQMRRDNPDRWIP